MSDELNEALDYVIFVDIGLPIEERRHQAKMVAVLKDAARRFASLTSPETIEKAARKMIETMDNRGSVTDAAWAVASEGFRQLWRERAEAVLRSVEEGTQ